VGIFIGESFHTFCEILDISENIGNFVLNAFSYTRSDRKQNINLNLSKLIKTIGFDNCYSSKKAKKTLEFKPLYNLGQGLKESVEWYKNN